MSARVVQTGTEWLVDASGCRPEALRDLEGLRALLDAVVRELDLRPCAEPQWKAFPGHGGVTGMYLLAESHLTLHTFPEHGYAAFNLYCCTPRRVWRWQQALVEALGARDVRVRAFARLGRLAVETSPEVSDAAE